MLLGSAGAAIVGLAVVLLVRWAVANDTSFYARVDAQRAMFGLLGLITAFIGTLMALFHGIRLPGGGAKRTP